MNTTFRNDRRRGASGVTTKRYTTKEQRKILESVGIPHAKGRAFDEAQAIIQEFIDRGELPEAALSPVTARQLPLLETLGIPVSPSMTKEAAAALIDANRHELDARTRPTEKQQRFIESLGGVVSEMTRGQASEFIDWLLDRAEICAKCRDYHNRRSDRCNNCGGFLPARSPLHCPRHILRVPPRVVPKRPTTDSVGRRILTGILDFFGLLPRHARRRPGDE